GVVVRTALRIVRAPILIIEKHVGDAAVWLIHANQIGSLWKLHRFLLSVGPTGRRLILVIPARVVALRLAHCHREWSGRLNDLAPLQLQNAQQAGLSARTWIVRGENVGRRAFVLGLLDGSFALQIEVVQEELAVLREVVE